MIKGFHKLYRHYLLSMIEICRPFGALSFRHRIV